MDGACPNAVPPPSTAAPPAAAVTPCLSTSRRNNERSCCCGLIGSSPRTMWPLLPRIGSKGASSLVDDDLPFAQPDFRLEHLADVEHRVPVDQDDVGELSGFARSDPTGPPAVPRP